MIISETEQGSRWRTWVMADKAEAAYAKEEILGRYLNRADYGRGAVGAAAWPPVVEAVSASTAANPNACQSTTGRCAGRSGQDGASVSSGADW